MTFVLPAEGRGVQDLLADGALLEEAFAGESTGEAFVTYRVPKFAFDSSYGLIPALERLGVVAAFGDQADFSNLSDTPAYVSSVSQESRIGLDENGVEASAYTKVDIMEMSALPDPSVIGSWSSIWIGRSCTRSARVRASRCSSASAPSPTRWREGVMAQGAPLLVVILGCMLPLKMQVMRRIPRPSLRVLLPNAKTIP